MFGGQSTVNLTSVPLKLTNAMWRFDLQTMVWTRLWANNTPGVPFLHEIQGGSTTDDSILFVSGRDLTTNPPRSRFFTLNITSLLTSIPDTVYTMWKELNLNGTGFEELWDLTEADLVSTDQKLFLIGGKLSNSPTPNHICTFWDVKLSKWFRCSPISTNSATQGNSYVTEFLLILASLGAQSLKVNYDGFDLLWVLTSDSSKEIAWLSSQNDPNTLPNRDGSGYIVYSMSLNQTYVYYINQIQMNTTDNKVSITTEVTNVTNNIIEYDKAHILPKWSHMPSCLIINQTLFLIGLPIVENQNPYQTKKNRIIALDLDYPISYFIPSNKGSDPRTHANIRMAIGIVILSLIFLCVSIFYIQKTRTAKKK
ncbi:hypothetical protein HK096_002974 [Nowakowskiella sp. JEL0078]|nr:hypothetical protein HK096_002974 [Nowakowskiella sp. JEL0078]